MDDDVHPFFLFNAHRLHQSAAFMGAVARVDVDMPAVQAFGAMIGWGW
jgi:hypothetical protein